MKKQDLQNGMIVKSSDGRYGVVCLKDATDSNCIKFFYDPTLNMAHGSVEKSNCGEFIVPLNRFTDDLRYICSPKEAEKLGLTQGNTPITLWSITEVFSLQKEWVRTTCVATCAHLSICKEKYDQSIVGCCKRKDGAFVGTMDEIHAGTAPCVSDVEVWEKKADKKSKVEIVGISNNYVSTDTKRLDTDTKRIGL